MLFTLDTLYILTTQKKGLLHRQPRSHNVDAKALTLVS